MAAMRMIPLIHYIPSCSFSPSSSPSSLRARRYGSHFISRLRGRAFIASAPLLVCDGFAIVGMHYNRNGGRTVFPSAVICGAAQRRINTGWLALLVIIVTMAILAIALIISVLECAWSRVPRSWRSRSPKPMGTDILRCTTI